MPRQKRPDGSARQSHAATDHASVTFADLLKQRRWDDYTSFIAEAPSVYASELEDDLRRESDIRARLRDEVLSKHFSVRKFEKLLPKAEHLLFNFNVVGIDGTVSRLRTLSGLRCQIGIVAVNYHNDKLRQSYFISETALRNDESDILDVLKNRERKNRVVSDMVVRALMLYREREVSLREEFRGKFKMLHGPLIPFELMTGLGRLRALDATLEILERIIEDKQCFSIISSTTHDDYMTLGSALLPGEYVLDEKATYGDDIESNEDFMAEGKWRTAELERVRNFLQRFACNIQVGIIKVSQRPYIFHAHRENFDTAAAIIARDSLLQREKGFPLLIDYADTLCSGYFPPGDFTSLLSYKLAAHGSFLAETPEQSLRLK